MKRLFLDTNIVIDLLDKREPFCYDAVNLFTLAYNKKDFENSKIPVMTAGEYLTARI